MMTTFRKCLSVPFILFMFFMLSPIPAHSTVWGKVVDSVTGQPVKGATVTVSSETVTSDEKGHFLSRAEGEKVLVKAPGYLRRTEAADSHPMVIGLTPFTPKALYLTVYGAGDRGIRGAALRLIEQTELNALVIDVKGDKGFIPYKSSISLASRIGAQKIITIRDIQGLISSMKDKGIYLIARIVTFKDDFLAGEFPELAVRKEGKVWRDREGLAWVDPFQKAVWEYNIRIAEEAARLGFDEIQFDYVRFPDTKGLLFSQPNTEENRVKAIAGFLREARKRLASYNVFLSADIFGYTCWNTTDTDIGQRLEDIAPFIDYIAPMLYPSGFQYGIPGYRNPVASPYEIVYLSLKNGQKRTNISGLRFRPWLQSFRDYAFDRRQFNGKEIRAQINAADEFGSNGWMLWNPRNVYSAAGLKKSDRPSNPSVARNENKTTEDKRL